MYNTFLDQVVCPQLTPPQRQECEGLLSTAECAKALHGMKNGSSPGPDGLGAAFFKVAWKDIGELVCRSLNYGHQTSNTLSISQKKAIIILLHKSGELSKDQIGNYRPISLTNVDYKIGAKALAGRLQNVIGHIISKDQTAYIKGRGITQNIRTIDDVITFLNTQKRGGILLALDFSKAFDSIYKHFIMKALHTFNFGPQFIHWISIYTSDTRSAICYNGWITEYFKVQKGIRQGCPLSALLFILGLELMACKLRNNPRIRGIKVPMEDGSEQEVLVSQFADDNTLFVEDIESMKNAFLILDDFRIISGLSLNKTKSEALWLGSQSANRNTTEDITWKVGKGAKVKILGTYFSNSEEASAMESNWAGKLDAMAKLIQLWEKRNLTVIGKIIVAKSLIASQIINKIQALCPPKDILNSINSMLFKFIWKGHDRVKRKTMIQPYECGDLKMFNVYGMHSVAMCKWVKEITERNDTCTLISRFYLNVCGRNLTVLKHNCTYAILKASLRGRIQCLHYISKT